MNNNTYFTQSAQAACYAKLSDIVNMIPWRQDYEAFRGNVWNWGHYQIRQEGTAYRLTHAGTTLQIGPEWNLSDQAAREAIKRGKD